METEHVPEGIEAAALARGARAREAVWRARAARAPTPALRQHSLNLADDYAVYAAELEEADYHNESHSSSMVRSTTSN